MSLSIKNSMLLLFSMSVMAVTGQKKQSNQTDSTLDTDNDAAIELGEDYLQNAIITQLGSNTADPYNIAGNWQGVFTGYDDLAVMRKENQMEMEAQLAEKLQGLHDGGSFNSLYEQVTRLRHTIEQDVGFGLEPEARTPQEKIMFAADRSRGNKVSSHIGIEYNIETYRDKVPSTKAIKATVYEISGTLKNNALSMHDYRESVIGVLDSNRDVLENKLIEKYQDNPEFIEKFERANRIMEITTYERFEKSVTFSHYRLNGSGGKDAYPDKPEKAGQILNWFEDAGVFPNDDQDLAKWMETSDKIFDVVLDKHAFGSHKYIALRDIDPSPSPTQNALNYTK